MTPRSLPRTRRDRRHRPLLVLAVVALIGCSSETAADPTTEASTTPEITLLTTTTSTTTTSTTTTTIPPTTTTSTTTTSTTTTIPPTTTTTVEPAIEALVLSMNGIGSAQFGADPAGVIDFVSSFLGAPTGDTGWVDPLTIGPCPGDGLRLVRWNGLTLEFGDFSGVAQDRRHFYAYTYGLDGELGVPPIGLLTDAGITAGSTVADLVLAYPDVILIPEDDFGAASFYVNDDFGGLLTGISGQGDNQGRVTVISGGRACRE